MRAVSCAFLLAALAAAGPARAAGPGDQEGGPAIGPPSPRSASEGASAPPGERGRDEQGRDEQGREERGRGHEGEGRSETRMSLDDARTNFSAVVETFVAKRSDSGSWRFQEKSGRIWELRLERIDAAALKSAGGNKYTAPAHLRDVRDGVKLVMNFVVDFGGDTWQVVGMTMRKSPARRRASPPASPQIPPSR